MKVGKPKSKRTPVRLRHRIEKASANKQRKQRKDAKKNPQWRSRLKKDPGVPNLFPYKDRVLAELEENKRRKEEEQQARRQVARAQREGRKVNQVVEAAADKDEDEDEDEELADINEAENAEDGSEDEMEEDTNPMAALLASAQARAQRHQEHEDDEEDEDADQGEAAALRVNGKVSNNSATHSERTKLPEQALADPIKAVSTLVAHLERSQEGTQQLLEFYRLPPLVTAGSDTATRFLVDVARKRGRLSRGGIPNLHAAALTVLGDLHEERLKLPALQQLAQTSGAASNKSEVQIVSQMAQPFRIEGLFGDPPAYEDGARRQTDMDVSEA